MTKVARPRVDPKVRFWAKVQKRGPDACWPWLGAKNMGGYGHFWNGEKDEQVHRFAYRTEIGPLSDGLHLDHLCRNRACVNPLHLEPVSGLENTLRSSNFIAMNARKVTCEYGHPLSGSNVYICPRGRRECRTCRREAMCRHMARKTNKGVS